MNSAVIFDNYEKKLGGKIILNGISLSIEEGSITWIIGPNGCGKTMLLRAISGLIQPDKGSVTVFGKRLSALHRFPDSVGIVLEHPALWDNLTGMETLKALAAIRKIADVHDCEKALERVGLDPKDRRTVRKYSLGMKQKLCIAQAIMERPRLLLLDEPLNALDKEAVKAMSALLREEKERGATIVISSHIENRLDGLCDATVAINEGRVESM
jgi:ABC-2 type transport system ATP-binding protein